MDTHAQPHPDNAFGPGVSQGDPPETIKVSTPIPPESLK